MGRFYFLLSWLGFSLVFFLRLFLLGFQPIKVLKNLSDVKLFSRVKLRKALLVSQFALSLIFIISVIVMNNQLKLFIGKDHGFATEKNMIVRLNNTSAQRLKTELLKYNNIENISAASHVPATGVTRGNGFKKDLAEKEWTNLNLFSVDEDYLKNIEVKLVAGKFFAPDNNASNRNFIVINSQALKAFGLSDGNGCHRAGNYLSKRFYRKNNNRCSRRLQPQHAVKSNRADGPYVQPR